MRMCRWLFVAAVVCVFSGSWCINVIDIISQDSRFSRWMELLRKSGLQDQFDQDSAEYTMFVPINDGFKTMPQKALQELMENPEMLKEVVLYHVVPGRAHYIRDLKNDMILDTRHPRGRHLRANIYEVSSNETVVTINGAKLLDSDVSADNSVFHVTNTFFCPVPDQSIAEMAESCEGFKGFRAIVMRANRFKELQSATGPMTVFAPTPEAFAKLDDQTMRLLMENETVLQELVGYHVMKGVYVSEGLRDKQWVSMVLDRGSQVQVYVTTDGYTKRLAGVNTARVLKPDIIATNGVIHLIDEVLLPRSGLGQCGIF